MNKQNWEPPANFKVNFIKPISLEVSFDIFCCIEKKYFYSYLNFEENRNSLEKKYLLSYVEFPRYVTEFEFRIAFVNINPKELPTFVEKQLTQKVNLILIGQDEIPSSPYRIPFDHLDRI